MGLLKELDLLGELICFQFDVQFILWLGFVSNYV